MRVNEIMSMAAQTCRPTDSLESVARTLWEHDIGFVPVVDAQGRPAAVITDRDICMAAYTRGRPLGELRVADSMSKGLVTCCTNDEITTAANLMAQHRVRRLPVLDAGGRLVGVLSLNDLAVAAAEHPSARGSESPAAQALRVLGAVCQGRATVPTAAPAAAPAAAPKERAAAART